MKKIPGVYFMSNKKHGTIYIGSTHDFYQRLPAHKSAQIPGFTKRYGLTKCVYLEVCPDTQSAI